MELRALALEPCVARRPCAVQPLDRRIAQPCRVGFEDEADAVSDFAERFEDFLLRASRMRRIRAGGTPRGFRRRVPEFRIMRMPVNVTGSREDVGNQRAEKVEFHARLPINPDA